MMSEYAPKILSNQIKNLSIAPKNEATETISKPEMIIKHPLQNSWTLWYFKNVNSQTWKDNQRQVCTVSTVEDFWALYNYTDTPSSLSPPSDYSFFKEGIFPDWEDDCNKDGGRWIINFEKSQKFSEALDEHWTEVLLFLIGEQADDCAHLLNGAVVNVRNKCNRIAIWLSAHNIAHEVDKIGNMIERRLRLKEKIAFKVHKDDKLKPCSSYSMKKSKSKNKH